MKRSISIFLLCYFMLAAFVPRMDFDRLYQIPDLAAHFFEHQTTESTVSFADFIHEHYGDNSEKPTDGHELPFQKHDCSVVGSTVASLLAPVPALAFDFPSTPLISTHSLHFSSLHLFDIWQPPRA